MSDNKLTNYIYLLQEREFIKTNEDIFKVGRTKKENHKRFNQYPKGSILIFQMICNNCENMETKIIQQFKEKFIEKKEIGKEYFQGDYKQMIDVIYTTIKSEVCDNKLPNPVPKKSELFCEKTIGSIFPDYKNDESFGGLKKYIKIVFENNEYKIYYISSVLKRVIEEIDEFDDDEFDHFKEDEKKDDILKYITMKKSVADRLQYFNYLLEKRKIILNTVYDINLQSFTEKINKTKFSINIQNFDSSKFNPVYSYIESGTLFYVNKTKELIRKLFYCNMLINNHLYSTMVLENDKSTIFQEFKKLDDFKTLRVDIGVSDYCILDVYYINLQFYTHCYVRKNIPYLIRWNTNNDFYILNRDYEYIGLDTKKVEYEKKGESYLYSGYGFDKNEMINICNNYKKIIKEKSLNRCLNPNDFFKNLCLNYTPIINESIIRDIPEKWLLINENQIRKRFSTYENITAKDIFSFYKEDFPDTKRNVNSFSQELSKLVKTKLNYLQVATQNNLKVYTLVKK